MIYLKEFQIPSDLWVAWYFSPWQGEPSLSDMPFEISELHPDECSFHNNWYPWTVFENRFISPTERTILGERCPRFKFSDITIFYGGNGSGKSTIINVIADKLHSERTTLHNTSPFFNDYVRACESYLNKELLIDDTDILTSRVITSDDVFQQLLSMRARNHSLYLSRRDLRQEHYEKKYTRLPRHINPNNREEVEEYAKIAEAKRVNVSQYINNRLNRSEIEKSNGENGFNYFVESIKDDSLILLDEPENSLSAMWQKELALFIQGAMREFNCQFIIASHSPFLLSIPCAKIYNLDAVPIQEAKWQELESMKCYFDLFDKNRKLFQ